MDIHQQWQELLEALRLRAKRLKQAIDVQEFTQKCEEILYWINDKVTQLSNYAFCYRLS